MRRRATPADDEAIVCIDYNPRTRLWEVTWRTYDGKWVKSHFIVAYKTKREADQHSKAITMEAPLRVYLNGNHADMGLWLSSPGDEGIYEDFGPQGDLPCG